MKKYGQIISKLRKKQGLTQAQLGQMLNVSYQAVSKWENDLSEPDLETIEKMTSIFKISISEFFDMLKNPNNVDADVNKEEVKKSNVNFLNEKPWYVVIGLSILIIVLSLCAFLIPAKYSSEKIYSMVNPSVFCITAEGPSTKQAGSGFFINNSGLAVTNYHVIENCTSGKIQISDGKTYKIEKLVGCDEKRDIAIIQVDIKKSKPIKFGNSNKLSVGEVVYAIGYPESFQLGSVDSTFTQGIISKTNYTYEGNNYIQTTVDMTHGNSGGVLVNQQGKVVGITTLMLTNGIVDYMNMAIPINKVKDIEQNINVPLQEYYEMHKTFQFYSDGRIIGRQSFVSGNKITPIEDPTKTGYTFDGWYADLTFEEEFNFDLPVTDQIACYAKWTPNTYTIKFDANGGTGTMQDIVATYDKELSLPTNAFKYPHYTFINWKVEGKEINLNDNQVIKNLTNENNAEIVLKAVWEIEKYTIHFDGNEATEGEMSQLVLEYDKLTTLPENKFTKIGYMFNGWLYNDRLYQDLEEVSKLSETPQTITFVAQWKPIKYKVKFVYEDDFYEQEFTYDVAENLISNQFTKEFYHFSYWQGPNYKTFLDESEILNLTNVNNDIIVFNAILEEFSYCIRYNPSNEVDLENSYIQTLTYTQQGKTQKNSFTKDGYKFKHWIDGEGNIYEVWTVKDGNFITWDGTPLERMSSIDGDIIDFFAVWDEITYTAYYSDVYKGESSYIKIGDKTYEEEFVLVECPFSHDGYEFSHYELPYDWTNTQYRPGQTVKRITRDDKTNVYIKAVFVPKEYRIVFDGNGATDGEMNSITAKFELEVDLPKNNFTKDGFIFIGWQLNGRLFKDADCVAIIEDSYVEEVTLTALWYSELQGEGIEENPYLLNNFDDFMLFVAQSETENATLNKFYKLTTDLDFENLYFENIKYFKGTFDGDGHVLKNITIVAKKPTSSMPTFGVFNYVQGTIRNLGIENYSIQAKDVTSSSSSMTIAQFGGLVAQMHSGQIINCYTSGKIDVDKAAYVYAGGLVGFVEWGLTIKNSYANLELNVKESGKSFIGVLIGLCGSNVTIDSCYAISDMYVKTKDYLSSHISALVGTVSGSFYSVNISNCFVVSNILFTPAVDKYIKSTISDFIPIKTDKVKLENIYTSSSSIFKFTFEVDEGAEIKLSGMEIDDNSLMNETWAKENLFIDSINQWCFDGTNYPKLKIFDNRI